MTTDLLALLFVVSLLGLWLAAKRLEEIADLLKEIKDLLGMVLDKKHDS
jgi:hypothetical protein